MVKMAQRKGKLNRKVRRDETGAQHDLPKGTPVIECIDISSSQGFVVKVDYKDIISETEYTIPFGTVDWQL